MELGRFDIQLKVALMSQYQMNPREGNLEALYFIFQFFWNKTRKIQVMEPSTQMIDESVFHYNADWVEFYGHMVEEDPPRMPEPVGFSKLQNNVKSSTFGS